MERPQDLYALRLVDTDLLSAIVYVADARSRGAYARVDDSSDGWTRPSAEQVTGRPAKARTRHFFRIPSKLEMEAAGFTSGGT